MSIAIIYKDRSEVLRSLYMKSVRQRGWLNMTFTAYSYFANGVITCQSTAL